MLYVKYVCMYLCCVRCVCCAMYVCDVCVLEMWCRRVVSVGAVSMFVMCVYVMYVIDVCMRLYVW